MSDVWGYPGRRVIVTGAASGMGEATARLVGERGGEVHAIDVVPTRIPVTGYLQADLSDPADMARGHAWCAAHPEAVNEGYSFSKMCIIVYCMRRCQDLARAGIRINSISPGPTDTAMMPHFEQVAGKQFMDDFPRPVGRN